MSSGSISRVLVTVNVSSELPGLVAYVVGGEHIRDLMERVGERCNVKRGTFHLMFGNDYLHPDDPVDVLHPDDRVRLVLGTFDPAVQYRLGRREEETADMSTASQDHVDTGATPDATPDQHQPVEAAPVAKQSDDVKDDKEDCKAEEEEKQERKKQLSDTTTESGPRRRNRRSLRRRLRTKARDRTTNWQELKNQRQEATYQVPYQEQPRLNHVRFNQDESAEDNPCETDEPEASIQGNPNGAPPVIPDQPLTSGARDEESESDCDEQSTYAVFSPEPPESPAPHWGEFSALTSLAQAPPPLFKRRRVVTMGYARSPQLTEN